MTGLIDGRPINRGDLEALCGVSLPTVDGWVEKGARPSSAAAAASNGASTRRP